MNITKHILIEDLVKDVPSSVRYLMEKGIRCIICGEPIWGTLEEAAMEKGFKREHIEEFVNDLNELAQHNQPDETATRSTIKTKKIND